MKELDPNAVNGPAWRQVGGRDDNNNGAGRCEQKQELGMGIPGLNSLACFPTHPTGGTRLVMTLVR
jgi:hypothetical protein